MIYMGVGICKKEPKIGEIVCRSCWECNISHEHLKKVNRLYCCFFCGRSWVFDRFLTSFYPRDASGNFIDENTGHIALETWLSSMGVGIGESTTKVDLGYKKQIITLSFQKASDLNPNLNPNPKYIETN